MIKTKQEYDHVRDAVKDDSEEHSVALRPNGPTVRAVILHDKLYVADDRTTERRWIPVLREKLVDGMRRPEPKAPDRRSSTSTSAMSRGAVPQVPSFADSDMPLAGDVTSRPYVFANPLHWESSYIPLLLSVPHLYEPQYPPTLEYAPAEHIALSALELSSMADVVSPAPSGGSGAAVTQREAHLPNSLATDPVVLSLQARGIEVELPRRRQMGTAHSNTWDNRRWVDADTGARITDATTRATTFQRFTGRRMVDSQTGKPPTAPGSTLIPYTTWMNRRLVDAETGKIATADTKRAVTRQAYAMSTRHDRLNRPHRRLPVPGRT